MTMWFPHASGAFRHPLFAAVAVSLATFIVSSGSVLASCRDQLAAVDARLSSDALSPQIAQGMRTLRDMGAQDCARGDESAASAKFTSILQVLGGGFAGSAGAMQMPSGFSPGRMPSQSEQPHRKAASPKPEKKEPYALGVPRDDLARFHGLYGTPGMPNRNFFVAAASSPADSDVKTPPGYLMIGPMWADTSPWYMKSVSDTRFEQQWVNEYAKQLIAQFEVGADGKTAAVTFQGMFEERGRMERLGDLPEGW